MASSDNLAAIEPWMFRSTIGGDSWYSDAFSRETETALTKALQQSLFNHHQHSDIDSAANHPISSSFMVKQSDYCSTTGSASTITMVKQSDYCSTTGSASTITASGSGSEPETPGSKRRGPNLGVNVGKTAKRKSRASKRSMTTFIQADPSNFRQMVQQVTGVKLEGNGQMPISTVVKPEALRQPFINKLQGLLPTLDTSRYLLDHHNNNTQRIAVSSTGFSRPPAMADGGGGGGGIDFDSFASFPTLESWN